MDAAVNTLQMVAQQLRRSGEVEPSRYAWMLSQLRGVLDELNASERRKDKLKVASANLTDLLHEVMALRLDCQSDDGGALELPDKIMVEGPVQDLRDLLCCLTAFAPNNLRAEIERESDEVRQTVTIEFLIQLPDLPDFLRRKLWDTARVRRGKVSIISQQDCCRVRFTLPTERRG
jgi:hypothetical protein